MAVPDELTPRLTPTPAGWAATALADPAALFSDHAHCERKAAATALSLLGAGRGDVHVAMRLARLAEQEAEHLRRVLEWMQRLGLQLHPDHGNPYAKAIMAAVRQNEPADRYLAAALIEARSHERLDLLREAVAGEPDLAGLVPFLDELAACEAGHAHTYVSLAVALIGAAATEASLRRWEAVEASAIAAAPPRSAVH